MSDDTYEDEHPHITALYAALYRLPVPPDVLDDDGGQWGYDETADEYFRIFDLKKWWPTGAEVVVFASQIAKVVEKENGDWQVVSCRVEWQMDVDSRITTAAEARRLAAALMEAAGELQAAQEAGE